MFGDLSVVGMLLWPVMWSVGGGMWLCVSRCGVHCGGCVAEMRLHVVGMWLCSVRMRRGQCEDVAAWWELTVEKLKNGQGVAGNSSLWNPEERKR